MTLGAASTAVLMAVSPAIAQPYTIADANAGAQLRAEAGIAVSLLYFPCHRSAAMEAPLARYEAFKAGLTENRQKLDLAIAKADFDYQMSLVDIDCPDPVSTETAQMDAINASVVNSVLDRMDQLIAVSNVSLSSEDDSEISGEWVVDLRLSSEDPEYTQPMIIDVAEDKSVTGFFYGSPVAEGRFGTAQGRDCIAFRSSDNSGPYQHSACLVSGKLVGQSWSEGRSFVLPWTAERK